MKYYFVELFVTVDGYEKITHQVVLAEDEEAAGLKALRGETHNEPDREVEEGSWYDDGMLYEVGDVTEIPETDQNVLFKYMRVTK